MKITGAENNKQAGGLFLIFDYEIGFTFYLLNAAEYTMRNTQTCWPSFKIT